MKTLDEVIKALEVCTKEACIHIDDCPYSELAFGEISCVTKAIPEMQKDALHYLKEYRRVQKRMESIALGSIEETLAKMDNPPLPWEELKQMEGKPVWVEILSDEIDLSSRWMLVARETKAHSLPLAYTDDMGHWIYGHEDDLGKTWQAYRKERE